MSIANTDSKIINTDKFSSHLRGKGIIVSEKKILITKYEGSLQSQDITEPLNCKGYGRIRHFRLGGNNSWPINPLPILPAAKALKLDKTSEIRAQVFQNSVCNWRCWYCFVDYDLLSGDPRHADFLTCDELLDLYLLQENPPFIIDLTGGQPDLTPEWVPWMMEALIKRELQDKIFLWSDDNLSNDYLWKFLTEDQINLLSSYKMYSRVCCFKGIDEESFSLNTKADPVLYKEQFNLCSRLIDLGLDLYCYITVTARSTTSFGETIPRLFDKLQNISPLLPLRTVPLEIIEFTPLKDRMNEIFRDMIKGQYRAIEVWRKELQRRFTFDQLNLPITEIDIRRK